MTLLKRHRIANGFSQTTLARALGITQSAVSYWENGGKLPRPELIKPLAKLLKLKPMALTRVIVPDPTPAGVESR